MAYDNKSPITFSITGILSTGSSSKKLETKTPRPSLYPVEEDIRVRRAQDYFTETSERRGGIETVTKRYSDYAHYFSESDSLYAKHFPPFSSERPLQYRREFDQSSDTVDDYRNRLLDSPSPPKIFCSALPLRLSPLRTEQYPVCSSLSSYSTAHEAAPVNRETILSSQNGRFRPPPFFETVLTLRKRLYNLGGKSFPVDEPPSDRNVHKLWRSLEKHKVNYSLQHYFYVASLSNRCFDLVERIHHKVLRGLLEGSRDKEVNQSYFNFLYGKTEEERYEVLKLLERGEISPKTVSKGSSSRKTNDSYNTKCHNCKEQIEKLSNEKQMIERKFDKLKRKYDTIISKPLTFYSKDGRQCIKSKSV